MKKPFEAPDLMPFALQRGAVSSSKKPVSHISCDLFMENCDFPLESDQKAC